MMDLSNNHNTQKNIFDSDNFNKILDDGKKNVNIYKHTWFNKLEKN